VSKVLRPFWGRGHSLAMQKGSKVRRTLHTIFPRGRGAGSFVRGGKKEKGFILF